MESSTITNITNLFSNENNIPVQKQGYVENLFNNEKFIEYINNIDYTQHTYPNEDFYPSNKFDRIIAIGDLHGDYSAAIISLCNCAKVMKLTVDEEHKNKK